MRLVLYAGVLLFAGLCAACGSGSKTASTRWEPDIGEEVLLHGGGGAVAVCSDTEVMRDVRDAAENKNNQVITGLVRRGKAIVVPDGTRAKIKDSTLTAFEVMILEGEYASRRGYVYQSQVRQVKDQKPAPQPDATPARPAEPPAVRPAAVPTKPKVEDQPEAVVTIRPKKGKYPVLAADVPTWKEYDDALLNDKAAVVRLTTAGKIVPLLPGGTRVVKLNAVQEFTYVRLADGEHKGSVFVVPTREVEFVNE